MDIKLTNYFVLILIFAVTVLSYGFDSATSCSHKTSRHGRAQLLASIPCDLTKQPYCNLPGSQYPWIAVRRFVHENQGLMKRMYGDIRHISILRSEINNNEIDVEDYEATAARYSENNFRKIKYLHSESQNTRNNDILNEPHFRPTSTTVISSTTTSTPSVILQNQNASLSTPTNKSSILNFKLQNNFEINENTQFVDSPNNYLETNDTSYKTNIQKITMETIKLPLSSNFEANKSETATISTTLKVVQQIIQSEIEIEKDTKRQKTETEITSGVDNDHNLNDNVDQTTEKTNINFNNISLNNETIRRKNNSSITEELGKHSNEIFIEKKKNSSNKSNTIEGQFFQDTVQKEIPVMMNLRGVNACPVKEEVVAPFWANNTRGEVLALLNLYPFEQYVHWEKCTHENKQMYCREGCRCEQQYRLHRLLAYDPHNECRGIFSDWFRFPSCCICKCYDIPFEFRTTSRSPRASVNNNDSHKYEDVKQHPIDFAEDKLQQAVYEHATQDWYRPRNDNNYLHN